MQNPGIAFLSRVSGYVLAMGLLFAASLSFADTLSCLQVGIRYGEANPNFVHNTKYTYELEEKSIMRDQCLLGSCSFQGWMGMFEATYHYQNYETIVLSEEYTVASYWRMAAIETLKANNDVIEVDLASSAILSRRSMVRLGLMPKEAWKGHVDFHKAPIANKVSAYLKNVMGRAKWNLKREMSSEKRKLILSEAEKQINEILDNATGPLPRDFIFRRQKYFPQSFAYDYFPDIQRAVVDMRVSKSPLAKKIVGESGRDLVVETPDMLDLEKAIIHILQRGYAAYLTYDHHAEFVDAKTGIMSLEAVHAPLSAKPLNREQRKSFGENDKGHSVLIVGVDVDPVTHRLIKLKLKGSWGDKYGDRGYKHMYRDYFLEFATSATFYRDLGAPIPLNERPAAPWQFSLF